MNFGASGRVRARICQPVETRDGTRLSADVYLPPDGTPRPALLTMTPYDNNRSPLVVGGPEPIRARADVLREIAEAGYVVVVVDARGSGDSDGEFVPFAHDAQDGADVIAWARRLAECDGRVGVWGSGYAGFAALAAAVVGDPDAVYAIGPFGLGDAGLVARGGAIRLEWLFWMHLVAGRTVQPPDLPRWTEVFAHLPLAEMPDALGRADTWWSDWIAHADPGDERWSALRAVADGLASVRAPILLQTGWWDTCLPATLAYWRAADAAGPRHLVVGPWDTAAVRAPARHVGGVDFGPAAAADPTDVLLDWFDRYLREADSRVPRRRARVFVTGAGEWRDGDDVPVATSAVELELAAADGANTRAGDGFLGPGAAEDGGSPDAYAYDPDNPVAFQPAFRSFSRNEFRLRLDESHLTTRDDVLVYTTEPLSEPLFVAGSCRFHLYASTDAPDTDWFATLTDVFPHDGPAIHLAHAALRAATSAGFEQGSVVELLLDFTPVAHVFRPGHALRLAVTSSLHPLYARNPNDGTYVHARETRIAHQRVHHDMTHRSRLVLPTVEPPLPPARPSRTRWFA